MTFNDLVGAVALGIAIIVVSIAAVRGSEPAMTALVGVVGAGVGFFLRAKVQPPT